MLIQYTERRQCDLRLTPPSQWPPEANTHAQAILQSSWERSKMAAELFPVEWLIAKIEMRALGQAELEREFAPELSTPRVEHRPPVPLLGMGGRA